MCFGLRESLPALYAKLLILVINRLVDIGLGDFEVSCPAITPSRVGGIPELLSPDMVLREYLWRRIFKSGKCFQAKSGQFLLPDTPLRVGHTCSILVADLHVEKCNKNLRGMHQLRQIILQSFKSPKYHRAKRYSAEKGKRDTIG